MSVPVPTRERQEHLDAIVAFADAEQRRRMFKERWATGDLNEQCRFLPTTQLMFVKEERPTTQIFDDDEWIRSFAGAEALHVDIEETNVVFDDSGIAVVSAEVDPKKVRPIQMTEFLQKCLQTALGCEG